MSIDASIEAHAAAKPNPSQKKTFICDRDGCSKSFSRPSLLKRHVESHLRNTHQPTELYKCDEPDCTARFFLSERLKAHKLAIHSGERPFKCDLEGCDKSYKVEAHLKRHKIQTHSSQKDFSQVTCNVKGCGNTYCNKYVLKQHMARAHVKLEETVTANGIKKKCDVEKRHRCDEPGCKAAFNRPYRLKNHKLTVHGGEKPYKCDHKGCDKSYTNESHLARHKTTSHYPDEIDTEKEVICGMEGCGRIFSNKYNLKKHISKIHSEFPFPCSDCMEKFKRKSHLHAHEVEVHDKEAPYKCNLCPRMFIHLHLYNKHMKNHKTYRCDCEEAFDKWSTFLKHRKTKCTVKQREFKCIICGKIFHLKHKLMEHSLKVHVPDSQSDLIKCPYLNCKYSYKYQRNLKYHIQTCHQNLFKRIRCPEKNCQVVLKSNRTLKQHVRVIHHGLPDKVRKPRRPRKDKGKPKKSLAAVISGIEVSSIENYRNIMENIDENLKQEVSDRLAKDEHGTYKLQNTKQEHREIETTKNCMKIELMDEKDRPNVVESSSYIPNNDKIIENRRETCFSVVSMDIDIDCSRNPIAIENKLGELEIGLTQYKSKLTIESDIVNNQNNSNKIGNCETNRGNFDNKDSTILSCNSIDMIVNVDIDTESSENVILEIPSNEHLIETQNSEIDREPKYKSVKIEIDREPKYKSVKIVDCLQCNVQERVVDTTTLNTTADVVFEFPEFENSNHSNNAGIINNEEIV